MRGLRLIIIFAIGALALFGGAERTFAVSTITVDSTADADTRNTVLTLREALLVANGTLAVASLTPDEANNVVGVAGAGTSDTIVFAAAQFSVATPGTIQLNGTPLPSMSANIDTISATSGAVIVKGAEARTYNCLNITSTQNTVTGLVFTDCNHAIALNSAAADSNTIGNANTFYDNNVGIFGVIDATGNVIRGNNIGVLTTGASASPDGGNGTGIQLHGGPNSVGVSSGAPSDRNVVSANTGNGIEIANSSGTVIQNNRIGVTRAGSTDLGNGLAGVYITGPSSGTMVGGTTSDTRNVISGNAGAGIDILDSDGNTISGNFIGVSQVGELAVANSTGVLITSAANNTVGGSTVGERNVISGNGIGVQVSAPTSTGNNVEGNYIGVAADGLASLGNTGAGVLTTSAASNNIVGSAVSNAAEGNLIANNGGDGVHLSSGTGNIVEMNSLRANAGLGIDLGTNGVTPNDNLDPDTGANNLQNAPILDWAASSGTSTQVFGTLNTTASTAFSVDFYHSATCDSSGNGEGEVFLGSLGSTTNASGNANLPMNVATGVAKGRFITATATVANSTSEFSNCVPVVASAMVNSLGDPGNGVCDVAACTLEEAINVANSAVGLDEIHFRLTGSMGIALTGPLPTITDVDTAIFGSTQPGYSGTPLVELNGTNAGAGANGLVFTGDTGDVFGLAINRFPGAGILIQADGVEVGASYIGIDKTGTIDLGNGGDGVLIDQGSNNAIRDSVLSGNGGSGVEVTGAGVSATNNELEGNYIGTNAAGIAAIPNGTGGVRIGADGNFVSDGNIISGNTGFGVQTLAPAGSSNRITGNLIGLNAAGNALGNSVDGVAISAGTANVVGGDTEDDRNVISSNVDDGVALASATPGNFVYGNYIGLDPTGTLDRGNGGDGVAVCNGVNGNHIGGPDPGEGNVISGNGGRGVHITGANGNDLYGNRIGTNALGTAAVPNALSGVATDGSATNNFIGGSSGIGQRNLISGNQQSGILLTGSGGDHVDGNIIGLAADGITPLANSTHGIEIGTPNHTIGTSGVTIRNVISGNGGDGIRLTGTSTGNLIYNNYIGTDIGGTLDRGNAGDGIHKATGGGGIEIGHTGQGINVISGNGGDGIEIVGGGNTIEGNRVGTKADGTGNLGNGQHGIFVSGTDLTDILDNISSGNGLFGIRVLSATNTSISRNRVGIPIAGTFVLGNTSSGIVISQSVTAGVGNAGANLIGHSGGHGLVIDSSSGVTATQNQIFLNSGAGVQIANSSGNRIGGGPAADANIITSNVGDGIEVVSGINNRVALNRTEANGGLGIDLSANGVTPNDAGDGDSGANSLQNFPIITSAIGGASLTIKAKVNTAVINGDIDMIVYRNAACDPSGHGEGQIFMSTFNMPTDGSGNAFIDHTIPVAVPNGTPITMLAATGGGNTSEFSACVNASADTDGDTTGDSTDNCPNWPNPSQALPTLWTVPAGDSDCDGFTNTIETYLGTDPTLQCAANTGLNNEDPPDRWPVDMNDNQTANTIDVGQFVFTLNESNPNHPGPNTNPDFNPRHDFNGNGTINTIDVGRYVFVLNESCTLAGP